MGNRTMTAYKKAGGRMTKIMAAGKAIYRVSKKKYSAIARRHANLPSVVPLGRIIRRKPRMMLRKNTYAKKLTNLQAKITGFNVSRFTLKSYNFKMNVADAGRFGLGLPMSFRVQLEDRETINIDPPNNYPGVHRLMNNIMFCPQWPGSKMASISQDFIGDAAGAPAPIVRGEQKFGLQYANADDAANNLKWNDKAVADVHSFLDTIVSTPVDQPLETNHTRIKVLNTYVQMTFSNPGSFHRIDVHVFDVIFRSDEYNDGDNCTKFLDANAVIEELIFTHATNITNNANSTLLVNEIRKGKLPSKIFKVLRHRKVALGRNQGLVTQLPNVADQTLLIAAPHSRQPSSKTITQKYGLKTWYRSPCTKADQYFSDEPLTEHITKVVHTICIPLIALDDVHVAFDAEDKTFNGLVNYVINKTNVWKHMMNNT